MAELPVLLYLVQDCTNLFVLSARGLSGGCCITKGVIIYGDAEKVTYIFTTQYYMNSFRFLFKGRLFKHAKVGIPCRFRRKRHGRRETA